MQRKIKQTFWKIPMCMWSKLWLTKVAGLAVQAIQLLLIGPLLVAGGRDDEQAASPTEPTITANFSLDLSGTLVQQWKLCSRQGVCTYALKYSHAITDNGWQPWIMVKSLPDLRTDQEWEHMSPWKQKTAFPVLTSEEICDCNDLALRYSMVWAIFNSHGAKITRLLQSAQRCLEALWIVVQLS